ncbi:hypothetical protein QQO25_03005 [Corynebacterium lehmanniae]|nr:hypothetical protein [Corynebacterium lehmanniae]
MRIPAAIAAASLTLTPATPVEPVEQLLADVSATHETSITAINSAETDDEVRDVLIAWRKELIAASDELAELREDAAEDGLTEEEKATFDEAATALKRERAGVRQLRAELLPDDEPVVVPAPIEGLGGILGTTAIDAFERSEAGDAPIVFGIPGGEREVTKPTVVEEPTTAATTPTSTSAAFGPEVTHRVERLQDTETTETTTSETTADSTTTETSSTTSGTATESATSTTTEASATTTTAATTTTSSSTARTVLENRTTSATSSSTTSSSSTTRTTSSTTTTEDDDERDDDLADTGTPMRALIAIGMLSLMIGAALVLTGAIRPRGARK